MIISKLDEVKKLKFQIKILEDKIKELRGKIESQAIKYSDTPKINGFKDNLMELEFERLIDLEIKKEHLQIKIDVILEEFSILPELPYKVVYYRHVDSLRWFDISKKNRI